MARSSPGKYNSLSKLVTQTLMLAIVSSVVAGLLTYVVSLGLDHSSVINNVTVKKNQLQILFIVYVITFIFGMIVFTFLNSNKGGDWEEVNAAEELSTQTPAQKYELSSGQEARWSAEEDEALGNDNLEDVIAALDPQDVSEGGAHDKDRGVTLSERAQEVKNSILSFINQALDFIKKSRPKLDSFNKFGINLYVAGACDSMATNKDLESEEVTQIMVDCLSILGTKASQARKFVDTFQDYLSNPRYLNIIQAGREDILAHIDGKTDAGQRLETVLDRWNVKSVSSQSDAAPSGGTIAVMFTDIVGSTAMTQDHGDEIAQQVVRTHDRIVRAALNTYHGQEVKHTGDGIMASFANTANSVSAAIYIQRKTDESNKANPTVPLGIKIGINSGEPIVENNDLFGTSVQLSARIVDKASNHEIFVSEVVKGICAGKKYKFKNRGGRDMKGFDEPITLYEVEWQS